LVTAEALSKYYAATAQIAAHAEDAWPRDRRSTQGARQCGTPQRRAAGDERFDHAITSSRDLPLGEVVHRHHKYYKGYASAKAAVTLILATGVVPGAGEYFGRQELIDSQVELHRALDGAVDVTPYVVFRTGDWMPGFRGRRSWRLAMLRRLRSRPAHRRLTGAAALLNAGKQVPGVAVQLLDKLYAQAIGGFDRHSALAQATSRQVARRHDARGGRDA